MIANTNPNATHNLCRGRSTGVALVGGIGNYQDQSRLSLPFHKDYDSEGRNHAEEDREEAAHRVR